MSNYSLSNRGPGTDGSSQRVGKGHGAIMRGRYNQGTSRNSPNYSRSSIEKTGTSCSLTSALEMNTPMICGYIVDPNQPIKQGGKRHSSDEKGFISTEIKRMLKQGIIRKSHSSWRSQVEVIKGQQNWEFKINYAQTINKRFSKGIMKSEGAFKSLKKL